jgi:hypothetical protein
MALRPTEGLPAAPWLCRHCGRALWWQHVPMAAPGARQLVDARGRALCRPLFKHRYRAHELPRVERIPR